MQIDAFHSICRLCSDLFIIDEFSNQSEHIRAYHLHYTNRDVSDLIGFSPFHNSIFVHFVQSQFNENYYANCILREFVFKLTSIRTMFRSSDNCWHSLSWSFSLARHRLAQLFFFCENSNSNNSNKTLKTYQTLFMPIQNRSCHSISKFINLTSIGDSPNGIEH